MQQRGAGLILVADLGGSNTDLLLADAHGAELGRAVLPALTPEPTPAFLDALLRPLETTAADLRLLAVTGGRHRQMPDRLGDVPVRRVDEIAAIGRGGLIAGGCNRALIVSMGTGTALISADGDERTQHAGLALGGGTLRGLGERLLGTTDPRAIAALAAEGEPRGANLTIADIVGGDIGFLPGDMPAAYFARLADPNARPGDIAAAVLDMIGHLVAHMAVLTARGHGDDTVVFIGHMLEYPTVVRAAGRFGRAFGGGFVFPPEPGFAVARGALALACEASGDA